MTMTHFPYATLFRSPAPGPGKRTSAGAHLAAAAPRLAFPGQWVSSDERGEHLVHLLVTALYAAWRDRKSTRLNSSHVKISHAAFCFKRKNHEDNDTE